jgi:hypothetical protein
MPDRIRKVPASLDRRPDALREHVPQEEQEDERQGDDEVDGKADGETADGKDASSSRAAGTCARA